MAFYIKVTKEVAEYLKVTSERNRTKDGNILLWQADVARFPGDTVFERAAYAGGVALTAQAAKLETDGTEYPAQVAVPAWLEPEAIPEEGTEAIPEEGTEEPTGEAPEEGTINGEEETA